MRALWIEDQQLIVDALQQLLHLKMPEVSLDKARDLDTALRLTESIRYELLLLDWWLGTQDGEIALHALRAAGCKVPVLIVSGDEREPVMRRAMALGAVGFVPKSADPDTLVDAIRLAMRGVVSPPAPSGADASAGGLLPPLDITFAYPALTARQAEVFRELMRGHGDKQIARNLGISDTTVKTHVRAILQIVGVHKRGEAAHAARMLGAREH